MGSPRSVSAIAWFNNTAGSQAVFYLDDISFVNSSSTPTPTPIPGTGPALSVDANANRHTISPYIYGMNYATKQIANAINLPVRRWGGNSASRYNWQINVHNTGSDWYYENIPDADADSADSFITQNNTTNTQTLMTIPLIGWTPKRRLEDHPYDCAFKVSIYGAQDSVDTWDTNCGNGIHNGVEITGNNPANTSIAITPSFVTDWVDHLTNTFGTAANGGVMFYNLDNEPGIWNGTHRDIHPQATTYDEMRDQTYAYAAALKAADPSALTLGPVEDGWCRYFFSGADDCNPNGADRTAHGNVDYVAWYLQQMHTYETNNNVRILDYFDLHIYPQGNGIFSDSLGNASVQALRLRSTRQLWDPTYVDESWIGGTGWENGTVMLIPRMKSWVNNNYPGTKLSISEYSWGALDYMNGALAQADVLGIFGREGLDLATLWGPPTDVNAPGVFAFRMYRNYDGNHSQFGDTSISASSADQSKLAIYAAQRTSDSALTLMVINKTSQTLTSTVSLANFQSGGTAQVYRYSSVNLTSITHEADQVVTSSGFTAGFPANSITLFVLSSTPPVTIKSIGSQDGWILESSETSNQGGTLNSTATLLYVGDDAQDKQYKSFLSFDTSGLPDNATITKVQLKFNIKAFIGGNMFTPTKTLGNLLMDILSPFYGTSADLELVDFQSTLGQKNVGVLASVPAKGWYTVTLKDTAFPFIDPAGTTQFRLRFKKDDNDDLGADYLKIYSGDAGDVNSPQLIVEYYVQ